MGTNSKERRKAKQRAKQQQRRRDQRTATGDTFSPFSLFGDPPDIDHMVEVLMRQAAVALEQGSDEVVQRLGEVLTQGPGGAAAAVVDTAISTLFHQEIAELWGRGWQPVDVIRKARRERGARTAQLIGELMAAQLRQYAPATVDEGWAAQLDAIGATVWWTHDDAYVSELAARERIERGAAIRRLIEVLHVIGTCPDIEMLGPPPGQARRGSIGSHSRETGVDERKLDRVRALLAKAEATSFAEEAEAYSAKAQELMARHSIDYALLAASSASRDEPAGRRIGVDNPYEAPKVLLLDAVAGANRCRTIWAQAFGYVTVLGFAADLAAVELLFTSLLVQANGAMLGAGSQRDRYGRSNTRSFRQSFLTAYAQRIGERLTAATQMTTEAVDRERGGSDLLPVLAARSRKVDDLTDSLFPHLTSKRVAVTNDEGWRSGRAAADQAWLTGAPAVESTS